MSVLVPLLFLLYIYDIVDNMLSIERLFADHSLFSVAAPDLNDFEGILNHDLVSK